MEQRYAHYMWAVSSVPEGKLCGTSRRARVRVRVQLGSARAGLEGVLEPRRGLFCAFALLARSALGPAGPAGGHAAVGRKVVPRMCDYLCFVWVRSGYAPFRPRLACCRAADLQPGILSSEVSRARIATRCFGDQLLFTPPPLVGGGAARLGMDDPWGSMAEAPLSVSY